MTLEQVLTLAMALSPQGRAFIAERLLESIDSEAGNIVSPEWQHEISKRVSELDFIDLIESERVFTAAREKLL